MNPLQSAPGTWFSSQHEVPVLRPTVKWHGSAPLFAAVLVLASAAAGFCQQAPDLNQLYQSHQLFAFRDAIQTLPNSPEILQGIVACDFNDLDGCERLMKHVFTSGADTKDKVGAHLHLALLYMVLGRAQSALPHYEEARRLMRAASTDDPVERLLRAFGSVTDMSVVSFHPSTLRHERGALNVRVAINGHPGLYVLDTGAGFSAVRESEAKRIGLRIIQIAPTPVAGFTGAMATIQQVGIAESLKIGQIQLRNVPFLVLPDASSDGLLEDRGGALGIQVLTALENIRWDASGRIQLGFRSVKSQNTRASNLVFDGPSLRLQAKFDGRELDFKLDTGGDSFLSERFAQMFPEFVKKFGWQSTWSSRGFGERQTHLLATFLPDLNLEIGTTTCGIHMPAIIDIPGVWGDGVIGNSAFESKRAVTLDFRRMMLVLE